MNDFAWMMNSSSESLRTPGTRLLVGPSGIGTALATKGASHWADAGVGGVGTFVAKSVPEPIPTASFINGDGAAVTLDAWRGKVVSARFGKVIECHRLFLPASSARPVQIQVPAGPSATSWVH